MGRLTFVYLGVSLVDPAVFNTGIGALLRSRAGRFEFKEGVGGQVQYSRVRMVSRGSEKVPTFDGREVSFLDYEHQVHLWMRTTRPEATARASVMILRMRPAPRRVCLAEGSFILGRSVGVAKVSEILRNNFAP